MNRILIIERNATFRNTLKSLLQSRFPGTVFGEAKNGEEGLKKAADFAPDIIFMDIKLPEKLSEINKKLKKMLPEATVVLLTHYGANEYRGTAEGNRVNHFLQKGSSTAEEIIGLVDSVFKSVDPVPNDEK